MLAVLANIFLVDMDKRTIQPGWCWRNVGWVHGGVSLCVPCDMDMMLRGCCTSTGMMLCKLSPPISPSCLFFCFSLPFISSPSLLPPQSPPLSYLHSLLPSLFSPISIPSSPLIISFPSSPPSFSFPPPYSLNLLFFLLSSSSTCPNTAGYKVLLIQFDRDGRHVMVCAR